jgi:hypothetical protein
MPFQIALAGDVLMGPILDERFDEQTSVGSIIGSSVCRRR